MAENLGGEIVATSVHPLMQALGLKDPFARRLEIAGVLETFSKDKAVALLWDVLLKSVDGESRKLVAKELANIGSERAIELLEAIMRDDFDPEVQHEAIKALAHIASDKATAALISELRDVRGHRRHEVAQALGELRSDEVVDALFEASKDYLLGDSAVRSLTKIGSDRAVERLIVVMQDMIHGSGMTSYDALQGLVRIGSDKAIDGLLQAWASSNSILGTRLYLILAQYKPKHLIEPLSSRLQDKTLTSNDRKVAAEMLGLIGSETEIPMLESVWTDWSDESEESREVGWSALRSAEGISLRALKIKAERERALEETRAFIVHEFRHALSPLNAYVKMLDEALKQPELDKESLLSLTTRIRKQTNTAFEIVNQYMDYSRPLAPKFREALIRGLVQHSVDEFRVKLEERRITVVTHVEEGLVAEVDEQLIRQVLRNVLDNAIHAIVQDGSLSVTANTSTSNIIIKICDSGQGIKPEHLPHVFEIGFTTLPGVQGAGIGLALSKRLIEEAHHGSITIANNESDPGVCVTLTLPIRQQEVRHGRQHIALAGS